MTRIRYSTVAILLHWTIVALLVWRVSRKNARLAA